MKRILGLIVLVLILMGCAPLFYAPEPNLDFTTLARTVVMLQKDQTIGSGVVVDAAGYIVTNQHVVADHSVMNVHYLTADNQILQTPGTVVFEWPEGDLAIVKIEPIPDLIPVSFGDADTVELGDVVYSIGHPYRIEWTVTRGIISAFRYDEIGIKTIQHDAGIAPGNSGGLLLNGRGELVGLNYAVACIKLQVPSLMRYGMLGRADAPGAMYQIIPLEYGYALAGNLVQKFASGVIAVHRELTSNSDKAGGAK